MLTLGMQNFDIAKALSQHQQEHDVGPAKSAFNDTIKIVSPQGRSTREESVKQTTSLKTKVMDFNVLSEGAAQKSQAYKHKLQALQRGHHVSNQIDNALKQALATQKRSSELVPAGQRIGGKKFISKDLGYKARRSPNPSSSLMGTSRDFSAPKKLENIRNFGKSNSVFKKKHLTYQE